MHAEQAVSLMPWDQAQLLYALTHPTSTFAAIASTRALTFQADMLIG